MQATAPRRNGLASGHYWGGRGGFTHIPPISVIVVV